MENALNRIWCARPCTTAPGMCPRKPLLHGPGPPAALDKGVTGHHRVYALSHSFLHHKEQQEAGMESREPCRCDHTGTAVVNPSQNPCLDTAQGGRAVGRAEELKEELLNQVPLPNICIWLLADR